MNTSVKKSLSSKNDPIRLTLKDKLRSRNTVRWHTVLTNIKQNVAEHSHCMAIIAETLLDAVYKDNSAPSIDERYWVLKYAIEHDLPEILTGDMPAVIKLYFKKALPEFGTILNALEYRAVPQLKALNEMAKEFIHLPFVCKAADLIEAYSYFLYAKGADHQHNDVVISKLHQALHELVAAAKKSCPQFKWDAVFALLHDVEHGDSAVLNLETLFDELD